MTLEYSVDVLVYWAAWSSVRTAVNTAVNMGSPAYAGVCSISDSVRDFVYQSVDRCVFDSVRNSVHSHAYTLINSYDT